MTDLDMWNAIVAFVLPLVVAAIIAKPWENWLKITISVFASLIVAGVTASLSGDLGANLTRSILVVLFGAMVAYRSFWKPLGVEGRV